MGGGEGSQIGFAHRAGSVIDGKFQFVAGAMDIDPKRAVEFGMAQGLDKDRSYSDWQEMLEKEKNRDERAYIWLQLLLRMLHIIRYQKHSWRRVSMSFVKNQ